MRKSLWIMLAVLFVAISAPNAQADSFTYTYTSSQFGIFWTTAAIPAVTSPTFVPLANITASSNTGPSAGCLTVSVFLDVSGTGGTVIDFNAICPEAPSVFINDAFALADYSTPGTHPSPVITGDTLVVTSAVAPVPEPSSVALMLLGLGLVLLLRKRNSRGHQLAT